MRRLTIVFLISYIALSMTSCFSSSWTEKQRKEFETNCSLTDTFNNVSFQFKGFDNDEFDSIMVKEFKDTALLDSFNVFVWPAQSPSDKERKERWATIERTMNTKIHIIL